MTASAFLGWAATAGLAAALLALNASFFDVTGNMALLCISDSSGGRSQSCLDAFSLLVYKRGTMTGGHSSLPWAFAYCGRQRFRKGVPMKLAKLIPPALVGAVGAWIIRVWIGSLKTTIVYEHPEGDPHSPTCDDNYVFAHWHEGLLLPVYVYGDCGQYTIVSQSDDGEYIARTAQGLGWKVIRGSSTRGAVPALRQFIEAASAGKRIHVAIAVDGPRGPRRQPKEGAVFIAAKTGMKLVPVGIAFDRPWRARSWDRFALPRPLSNAVMVFGKPIEVPSTLDREKIAHYQRMMWSEIDRVDAAAQRLADGESRNSTPQKELNRAA